MDLCHRAVDTPRAPQRTPLCDELIAGREVSRLVCSGIYRLRAHSEFSVFSESSFVARGNFNAVVLLPIRARESKRLTVFMANDERGMQK